MLKRYSNNSLPRILEEVLLAALVYVVHDILYSAA